MYTFEGFQFIFYKEGFQSIIKNLRINLHSIGDLVFGSINNAKCKQKYGANSGPQNIP